MVRNGYLPEREIVTGVGNVTVKIPEVRDRSGGGIKFNSSLVPPYVRKPKRVEAALPWRYLRGISTGDKQSALSVLLGDDAKGLSPAVASRLKAEWSEDYLAWNRRDLWTERLCMSGPTASIRPCVARMTGCAYWSLSASTNRVKTLASLIGRLSGIESLLVECLAGYASSRFTGRTKTGHRRRRIGFWAALDEA